MTGVLIPIPYYEKLPLNPKSQKKKLLIISEYIHYKQISSNKCYSDAHNDILDSITICFVTETKPACMLHYWNRYHNISTNETLIEWHESKLQLNSELDTWAPFFQYCYITETHITI